MKKAKIKRERIVRKKGWAKIGVFMFGLTFGIIFTLGSLVGIGFWAYKNLTLNTIEKLTNKSINIGNESLKKISIEDVVANISAITSDKNYTIEKLENDFGITIIGKDGFIPNELLGLDLTPLKNKTLSNIGSGFEDILSNATINTFLSFLEQEDEDLGMFANIINTKIDYYYSPSTNKLYEDHGCFNLVKFNYEIKNNIVTLNSNENNTYEISNNKISVPFRDISIESAFSSFDKVTDNLKIYEILNYHYNPNDGLYYEDSNYTTKLTGFIKILAGKSINDLSSSSFFDSLKIYEVFGYYYDGTNYYNYYNGTSYTEQVTLNGIEKALAQKSIDDLTSDNLFDDIYIYDILNLHTNTEGKYCEEGSNTPVSGVLNAIAGKTIGSLTSANAFDNIYLYDILNLYEYNGDYYEDSSYTTKVNGVLNSIAGKTISELSDDSMFEDIYIYEVMNYTREGTEGNYTYKDGNTPVTGVLKAIAGSTIKNLSTAIDNVKLGDALNLDGSETGVLNALKNTEIKNLKSKINTLTLAQALDLDGSETGVLKALSDKKITELESAIEDLTIDSALGLDGTETGVLKALSGTKITALESKINDLTLGEALQLDNSVTGVLKALKDTKINELNTRINNLKMWEVLGYTYDNGKYYKDTNKTTEVSGIMSKLVDKNINNLESVLTGTDSVLKTLTIGDLIADGIITDNSASETEKAMTISQLYEAYIALKSQIG